MLGLGELVGGSIEAGSGTAGERGIANIALHLLLVGLLGSLRGISLDGLRDVVGGVGDGVGDLADDAFVWLV